MHLLRPSSSSPLEVRRMSLIDVCYFWRSTAELYRFCPRRKHATVSGAALSHSPEAPLPSSLCLNPGFNAVEMRSTLEGPWIRTGPWIPRWMSACSSVPSLKVCLLPAWLDINFPYYEHHTESFSCSTVLSNKLCYTLPSPPRTRRYGV